MLAVDLEECMYKCMGMVGKVDEKRRETNSRSYIYMFPQFSSFHNI